MFSSATPQIALVIPVIVRIDKLLGDLVDKDSFEPAIIAATKVARKTLDRYYSLVQSSPVYQFAMCSSSIVSVLAAMRPVLTLGAQYFIRTSKHGNSKNPIGVPTELRRSKGRHATHWTETTRLLYRNQWPLKRLVPRRIQRIRQEGVAYPKECVASR